MSPRSHNASSNRISSRNRISCAVRSWSSVGCGGWRSVGCCRWSSHVLVGLWSSHHGVGWNDCRGCGKWHHRHQWLQDWRSLRRWSWLCLRLWLWLWLRLWLAKHGEDAALEEAKAAKQKQPNPDVHERSRGARLVPSPAVQRAAVLTDRRGAIV